MFRFISIDKFQNFIYYLSNGLLLLVPKFFFRRKLKHYTQQNQNYLTKEILDRLDYYIPNTTKEITDSNVTLKDFKLPKRGTMYFFDLVKYTNYFSTHFKITYKFGDVTENFKQPTIVKSRPIAHTGNSVLMKLDKLRHYNFITDKTPFTKKKNEIVWRGLLHNNERKTLVEKFYNQPNCNIGQVKLQNGKPEWIKDFLSIDEQLQYKFILSIEGIDVATNLKWIFSSNSLCFMPTPKYETWFMEGKLIPNVHYVHLKDDYSDLIEKTKYYALHEKEALKIIENQNNWVKQFKDKKLEKTLSLLVLDRYFKITGQS